MAPLLTITQQQAIKPISPNWASAGKQNTGVTNYDQLALEVEESKLRKLLGNALFQDVITTPTADQNVVLLNGGTFEDCDGNNIAFRGLRYVLAYFNWHKYVGQSFVSDTFTGMVKKNRDEAESLSSGDIKRLQLEAEDIALMQWELCRAYLDKNKDTYPLWKCGTNAKPFLPKFTGLKKTIL